MDSGGAMTTVTVELTRPYDVVIGQGSLHQLGERLKQQAIRAGTKILVVSNPVVAEHYGATVMGSLSSAGYEAELLVIEAGEEQKTPATVAQIHDKAYAMQLERSSLMLALGGGVVGDMAGFLAASYLRGVGFVQVPTTLLAQVDSSVGGKVGVNLKAGKNLVGAFYQPQLVLCDLDTLKTLPKRELRAGLAEVIKYGIIDDAALFRRLERRLPALLKLDAKELAHVVARSCQIKAKVVEEDEHEGGLRAILNYGHTIGHALEAISSYGKYLHGEAISIGQVAASKISREQHGLGQAEVERIEALFTAAGLPTTVALSKKDTLKLLAAMKLDKKVIGGQVKFVLAKSIGQVAFGIDVPKATIKASLQ